MPNKYLEGKIKKYDFLEASIIIILILAAFIAGRFLFLPNLWSYIVVGSVLGLIGGGAIIFLEIYIDKRRSYEKGLELEDRIEEKMKELSLNYGHHVETDYGDLDFFIEKNDKYFGLEAKNWPGIVVFENGLLKVNGWDNTDILSALLKHCRLVRDLKFGADSKKFIHPILVFGYKTDVNIRQNKITFNNVEIIVATIKNFEQFI